MSCISSFKWGAPWHPSTKTAIPFEWASSVISLTGKTDPVTFDKCVIAINFVFDVIFFSMLSKVISPSSLISANSIFIPLDCLKKCQGT